MMAAVGKKETLSEKVAPNVNSNSSANNVLNKNANRILSNQKEAKRQVLKEMAQRKRLSLEKEEKKKNENKQIRQKEVQLPHELTPDEKAKKAHLKALRIKAVEEAMREKRKNLAKVQQAKTEVRVEQAIKEEEENIKEEEEEDFDPSSLVETEIHENYEDTLVEVNIPGGL